MRNPGPKFFIALAALAIAASLLWLSLSGSLGAEETTPAMAAGMVGFAVLAVAGYYTVASALVAVASARLRAGIGVVARWRVPAHDWERFRAIGLADTGITMPSLRGLHFAPRRVTPPGGVEIIAGRRGALIDECYFALTPGKTNGLEAAGWAPTDPPCIALVIKFWTHTPSSSSTSRGLLLLPVPSGARAEGALAVDHYRAAVAGMQDLGTLARRYPARARFVFWFVLSISALAGALGFVFEFAGMPGELPAYLGITGTMAALGTLVLGWCFLPRGRD